MSWLDRLEEAYLAGEVSMDCPLCGAILYIDSPHHECPKDIVEDYTKWCKEHDSKH
jgi:hypothetical protein